MSLKADGVAQAADAVFDHSPTMTHDIFLKSSFTALSHIRQHLESLSLHCQPNGKYEEMCYHFHASSTLLMSLLDGLATYAEKKLGARPREGLVSWDKETTFTNPLFANLFTIKERSTGYNVKGGVTLATLRTFADHYLPWLSGSFATDRGVWDICLQTGPSSQSGLIIYELLYPLFNDARKAYIEVSRLLGHLDDAPKPPPALAVNAGQLG